MTIDDVQKITNIFKKQPMPKHQLYFTQQQIERMKTEGEDIDLNKMTINGYPFEILEDPFQEVYEGGDIHITHTNITDCLDVIVKL